MKTIRTTLKIFSFSLLILMCACGAPKRSTEDTDLNSGTDTSTPMFDTSGTSPTGTPSDNLFTTQTGTQLQDPLQGTGNLSNVSQSESVCLTSDSSFNLGSYGARGTASSNAQTQNSFSCLNDGGFGTGPELLYDTAITSYEAADYCLGQAASSYAPRIGESQFEIQLNMQLAELGLIRCMRDIIGFQEQALPWANAQTAAFNHADHNIWYIGQGINYR